MSIVENTHLLPAVAEDAIAITGVAVHVFLDTYATERVRPDIAAEAVAGYSVEAFAGRLAEPGRRFILAQKCQR